MAKTLNRRYPLDNVVGTSAMETIKEIMEYRNITKGVLCATAGLNPDRFELIMEREIFMTPEEANKLEVFGIAPANFLLKLDQNFKNANSGINRGL